MPSTALLTLKKEIEDQLVVISAQSRGLVDLSNVSLSPGTLAVIKTEIEDRQRRERLCREALAAIEGLLADGFPEIAEEPVSSDIFRELQDQQTDIETAIALFTREDVSAKTVTVDLGAVAEKP